MGYDDRPKPGGNIPICERPRDASADGLLNGPPGSELDGAGDGGGGERFPVAEDDESIDGGRIGNEPIPAPKPELNILEGPSGGNG